MPLPVIANTWACAYRFVLNGAQSAEWTFGVNTESESAFDIADTLQSLWASNLNGAISEQTLLTSVAVQLLDGSAAQFVLPTEHAGAFASPAVPDSVAMVVTLRTNFAGRSFRGRVFVPGISEVGLSGDGYTWGSSTVSGMTSDFTDWRDAMEAATPSLLLGVISRKLEQFTAVTSLQARTGIATQKRRLTGGVIF